jgi:hypothetical protein
MAFRIAQMIEPLFHQQAKFAGVTICFECAWRHTNSSFRADVPMTLKTQSLLAGRIGVSIDRVDP